MVGAGAAGLTAAADLSRAGASVVVLEARPRIGGRVWTRRIRGWPLPVELGAEFVHGRNEEILQIARDAGLLIDRLPAVHAEATGDGWKPTRGIWQKFDAITRTMRRDGRDRSIAEFLKGRRSLSSQDKRFVRGLIEGYHAADLSLASEHALSTRGDPPFEEDEEEDQFRVLSGYDQVTNFLKSQIDSRLCRIQLSTPVARIGWRRGDVRVATTGGNEVRARSIVVTVPVGVLKEDPSSAGAIVFDPDPPAMRRAIARIEMGRVERIVLRFRQPFWEESEDRASFFHRWGGAAFPTWWSAAPAEVPMITGWAGGPAADALAGLTRKRLVDRALESLQTLFGARRGKLESLLVGWHRHDWTGDPYSRGAYSYEGVGGANAPRALGRPISETLFFAGEATEPDENGTVPGAIASGRRAARLILRG